MFSCWFPGVRSGSQSYHRVPLFFIYKVQNLKFLPFSIKHHPSTSPSACLQSLPELQLWHKRFFTNYKDCTHCKHLFSLGKNMHNLSLGLLPSIMILLNTTINSNQGSEGCVNFANMNMELRKKCTLKYELKTLPRLSEHCGELSNPSDKVGQALRLNMDWGSCP